MTTSNSSDETVASTQQKHRRVNAFISNITASLALAEKTKSTTAPLTSSYFSWFNHIFFKPATPPSVDSKLDIEAQKIELVEANIIEHAARRVDLFFYLLVAVYATNVTVSKDSTVEQYGKGSHENGTQACHSSLFPNIKITPPPSQQANSSWWSYFTNVQTKPLRSFSDSYFKKELNSTVELPGIVNNFDGHLEGRSKQTIYTQECLNIVNRVAKAEIDPKEGMNAFLKIMQAFFMHIEYDYLKKKNKLANHAAFSKVWEYEKRGTFLAAYKDTTTIDDHYMELMLRLTRMEKVKMKLSSYFAKQFYLRMQDEIYQDSATNNAKPTPGK